MVCAIFLPEETLEEFFRKVNVSGSSWPHGKLSLMCKVKLQHD